MVVGIENAHALLQQGDQGIAIFVERDIEHGDFVAGDRVDALQQIDIAFQAGNAIRIARLLQTQLLQRANTIGIAVENIVIGHSLLGGFVRLWREPR